jgi:nucleoside-diphosphate-sugar epimerase
MNIKTRKKFTSIKELEEESKRLGIPFDYSKAEKELGYKTRPIEDTLRDEAKWLKDNGKI